MTTPEYVQKVKDQILELRAQAESHRAVARRFGATEITMEIAQRTAMRLDAKADGMEQALSILLPKEP